MEEVPSSGPNSPQSRRFVALMRAAAAAESAEARALEWRGRSEEEHARVFLELCDFGDIVRRSRNWVAVRPPLPDGRFPWHGRATK